MGGLSRSLLPNGQVFTAGKAKAPSCIVVINPLAGDFSKEAMDLMRVESDLPLRKGKYRLNIRQLFPVYQSEGRLFIILNVQ